MSKLLGNWVLLGGLENEVGPTSGKIWKCLCNRGLERKFGSPTRIGVHLEAPLEIIFSAHYPNNKMEA
jgi:hypothetical protein